MPVEAAAGQQPPAPARGASVPASGAPAAMLAEACAQSVRGFERAYLVTLCMATLVLLPGAMLPGWPGAWAARTSRAHAAPEPVAAD